MYKIQREYPEKGLVYTRGIRVVGKLEAVYASARSAHARLTSELPEAFEFADCI